DNWANDVEHAIRKYLDELKETNKEEIISLFDELSEEFSTNEEALENISSEELVRYKKEIEFLLHKCLFISL
ncbi:MAG TPA: GTP-binding protein, partial [Clostridium sp.]